MKELLKLFTSVYGKPSSSTLVKKGNVEFYVAVSVPEEPMKEDEYSTVITLGLSLTPELEEQDIEFELKIKGALPEGASKHFGEFFFALFEQLKSFEELEQGLILTDIPEIPYFKGATTVIIDDEGNYLDDTSDGLRRRLITVIPLYEQEVRELQEVIPDSRQLYLLRSLNTAQDPNRKKTIVETAVRFYCERITKWTNANGAREAEYWAKNLLSGGDPETGKRLEEKLGFAIPSDFKYFLNLLPLDICPYVNRMEMHHEDSIVESIQGRNDLNNSGAYKGAVKKKLKKDNRRQFAWWHERWVPIAMDSAGTYVVIDMAPGPKGVPGQLMLHDTIEGPICLKVPNFLTWLVNYYNDLNKGLYQVIDGVIYHEDER